MSSQTVRPMVVPPTRDHGRGIADLEVALLVEHAVVRQEDLAVDRPHLSVGQHGERVVDVLRVLREPDQRDHPLDVARDAIERAAAGLQEVRFQQQVLRRITVDRQLGEDDDLRAGLGRLAEVVADLGGVPIDVAHRDVDLGEGEAHRPVDRWT